MTYVPDVLAALGLSSLAAGLALYDPRLALVAVGLLLLTVAMVAIWRTRR